MMSGVPDLAASHRRWPRPARYLVRREAGGWRLYARGGGCGGFAGRDDAVSMAEKLASEAAFLGRPAYLFIETEGQNMEVRRLHRSPEMGDGRQRRLLTAVRWLAPRNNVSGERRGDTLAPRVSGLSSTGTR